MSKKSVEVEETKVTDDVPSVPDAEEPKADAEEPKADAEEPKADAATPEALQGRIMLPAGTYVGYKGQWGALTESALVEF